MNRRKFIQQTAVLSSLPLLNTFCSTQQKAPARFKLGYQLYSIRDKMVDAPVETLKVLKEAGYEDFEIYGYNAVDNRIYGLSPADFKAVLDDLGLTVSSGHYGFSDYLKKPTGELLHFVDRCIEAAETLNSSFITWPWLDPAYRNLEDYKLLAEKLNIIGQHITKNSSLQFAYHNHGYEFEEFGDATGYDVILQETDANLVKLQMDMYWVFHSAKLTPKELVANHPGRFPLWHIKDMDTITRDYTELGNGSINYVNALPDAKDAGLAFYYIEQGGNFSVDSTTSAIESARYFKKHLQHLL